MLNTQYVTVVSVHAITTHNGSRSTLTLIQTWALDGGVLLATRPRPIYPMQRNPGAHLKGSWVGSKVGVDVLV
jgi:hypothetical protein